MPASVSATLTPPRTWSMVLCAAATRSAIRRAVASSALRCSAEASFGCRTPSMARACLASERASSSSCRSCASTFSAPRPKLHATDAASPSTCPAREFNRSIRRPTSASSDWPSPGAPAEEWPSKPAAAPARGLGGPMRIGAGAPAAAIASAALRKAPSMSLLV
eukprot:scaffold19989_cov112-Isochrysis_galbana.AAC.7